MASYVRTKSGVSPVQLMTELNIALAPVVCVNVRIDNDINVLMDFGSTALNPTQISTMESVLAGHVKLVREVDTYVPDSTNPDAVMVTTIGAIYPVQFFDTSNNYSSRWLSAANTASASNDQPVVVPFKSKIVAVTFVSKLAGSSVDVEIYRGDADANTVEKLTTLQVRNARFYRKTNFAMPEILNAGDTLGVYLARANTSDKTKYPLVTIYLQNLEDGFAEKTTNNSYYLTRI